jgi:hypothetical protein
MSSVVLVVMHCTLPSSWPHADQHPVSGRYACIIEVLMSKGVVCTGFTAHTRGTAMAAVQRHA